VAVARPYSPGACRRACGDVRFTILKGFDDPATPDGLDRVGVLKIGSERARNVLVLNPGTSAGAGYFKPLAEDIVRRTHGRWQVWSVERGRTFWRTSRCSTRPSRGVRPRGNSSTITSAG
jgi:hypothetical protein